MAAPQRKFTVNGMSRIMSVDPTRRGKWDRIVAYSMDDGHGSAVFVPDEAFSEEAMRKAIKADMEDRSKWLGKSFPL